MILGASDETSLPRALGFFRSWNDDEGIYGIMSGGASAFDVLSEELRNEGIKYKHVTTFETFSDQLATVIASEFMGREPQNITGSDLELVSTKLDEWLNEVAITRKHFVPCAIITDYVPRFEIGPVTFIHRTDFLLEARKYADQFPEDVFDNILKLLNDLHATWIAIVEIEGFEKTRSIEVADLVVDFALVGLQLITPTQQARYMARVNTRPYVPFRISLSFGGGDYLFRQRDNTPGFGITGPVFEKHIAKHSVALTSVGKRITNFVSDDAKLPNLQRQWCDAAYWFHEGIAEPIDAIAVAKLETAIEVLLRSESSNKAPPKLQGAIDAFYGLKATDPINPSHPIAVKKLVDQFSHDRGRILHGTWSTLGTELRASRLHLALTLCGLLHDYTQALDRYAREEDTEDQTQPFLDWVKDCRTAQLDRARQIAAAVEPKQK